MGVPKFFRYITERYPCLSEVIKEYQIPEMDNLYLDMNGIVHMCSHPDDNNPHFRIDEERIFKDIFHYIEVLFRMIRPQKLFFMAVDGVAPRAKMNQQRGRRFRSAKDAEKMENDAIKKGEKLPDAARFDSNCITPGTVFMERLHQQLKYFVVEKVSTDSLWQKCKVILNGHETPGEGEHKIMDYIRYMKSQPGYDPNTRHCLYGLDADLIMLGMCTHEPHFSLLREEVKFGRKSTKRQSVPEEITFHLLHLSLMREYLELEFAELRDQLKGFEYDLEKIIDDWVLMSFLVGNDFIPPLPNLHIANGALPILYKIYIKVLPELDGYINESGKLNLKRFEFFMRKLASYDHECFLEIKDDLLYMEAKTGRKWKTDSQASAQPVILETWSPDEIDAFLEEALEPEKVQKNNQNNDLAALIQATDDMLVSEDEEEGEDEDHASDVSESGSWLKDDEAAFKSHKCEYYRNKLTYLHVTPEVLREQAEIYVRAIQWNLNYYYNGCCSWSWYYPHHYSPYISDVKGFSDLNLDFSLGKPFLPYEQLLAVLPSASKTLLPKSYHSLMVDEDSPIKDYYPEEFLTDLNGKKQEWEAVVLIPFIDEKNLLDAMKPGNAQLTEEEQRRNSHGPMLVYTYTSSDLGQYDAPDYFPSVKRNHALVTMVSMEELIVPEGQLVKSLYPGCVANVYFPGFPTMKHLKYKGELKMAKIRVFESPSRNETMVLTIIPEEFDQDYIPLDWLNQTVFVGWPNLLEAKVVALSNASKKYVVDEATGKYTVVDRPNEKLFVAEGAGIIDNFKQRKAIEVGPTTVKVHVKLLIGRRYVFTPNGRVNLDKHYSNEVQIYPMQTVVSDIKAYDKFNTTFSNLDDVFPVGCTCFTLTNPCYGSKGKVLDCKETRAEGRIKIFVVLDEEPDFSEVKKLEEQIRQRYHSAYHCSGYLGLPNLVFNRITGTVYVMTKNNEGGFKNLNVGLDLKLGNKNKEVPGYTRKIMNNWHYSEKTMELVFEYRRKFPEVFNFLGKNNNEDASAEQLFGNAWEEKLKELQEWLKSLPSHSIEKQTCGTSSLDMEIVQEIEKIVQNRKKTAGKGVIMKIKPSFLYRSEIQNGTLVPDSNVVTLIYDRIINVRQGYSVPLGLKGTVISIIEENSGSKRDILYDIIFDEPFKDGMLMQATEPRCYRLPPTAFINISFGMRLKQQKMIKSTDIKDIQQRKEAVDKMFHLPPPQVAPAQPFVQKTQNSAFASFTNSSREAMMMSDFVAKAPVQEKKKQPQVEPPPVVTQNPEVNTDVLKKLLGITSNKENIVDRPLASTSSSNQGTEANIPFDIFSKAAQAPATLRLMTYYHSNNLGLPKYQYFEKDGLVFAQILLHTGKHIIGEGRVNKAEATEAVANQVLDFLIKGNKLETRTNDVLPTPPPKWVSQTQFKDENKKFSPKQQQRPHQNHQQNNFKSNNHSNKKQQPQNLDSKFKSKTFHNSLIPLQVMKVQASKGEKVAKKNAGQQSQQVTNNSNAPVQQQQQSGENRNKHKKEPNTTGEPQANKPPQRRARKPRIAASFGQQAKQNNS